MKEVLEEYGDMIIEVVAAAGVIAIFVGLVFDPAGIIHANGSGGVLYRLVERFLPTLGF